MRKTYKWFKIKTEKGVVKYESIRRAENLKEAWDKTLKKWRLNAKGYQPIDCVTTCGLCNIFFSDCIDCPIQVDTGQIVCKANTYYNKWCDAWKKVPSNRRGMINCAKLELSYLENLKRKEKK